MAKGFPLTRVTISESSGALYLYMVDPVSPVDRTDAIGQNILVDLTADGKVAGIEFLGINGKRIEVDEILDRYATYGEDSRLAHEDAYFLRVLSLIEWNIT